LRREERRSSKPARDPERYPGVLPLIAPPLRRYVVAVVVLGAALTAVLGGLVFHGSSTSFDAAVQRTLYAHLDRAWQVGLLGVSAPWISFVLLAVIVVVAGRFRRWNVVALAIAGPLLALAITEWVLKPLIWRELGRSAVQLAGSYPSGHETGVTATALVIVVVCGQRSMPRWGRVILGFGLLAWAVLAAVGLVRSALHYPTDTIGAVGVSTTLVLGCALVIDLVIARFSSPAARSLPSTSRAA
jgi:membrane-associated phospholipid phosphatase